MAGDTDLVEEAMQALNNGGDLLGQVGGVHYARLAARSE